MTSTQGCSSSLKQLLDELEQAFSKRKAHQLTEQEYSAISAEFTRKLKQQVDNLVLAANDVIFTFPILKETQTLEGFYKQEEARTAEVTLRPEVKPNDLALRVILYRRAGMNPAKLELSLEFTGEGQAAFRDYCRRHWVELERLLRKSSLRMEADPEPESLKRYEGKQVYRQIGLYMSEEQLSKEGFSLRAEFDKRKLDQRFVNTFVVLAFIYESTHSCRVMTERLNEVGGYLRSTGTAAPRQARASSI